MSILLGFWADGATEQRHHRRWINDHSPNLVVWRQALGAGGFGELTHETAHRKVIRTLPSLVEPPGSVWKSSDGRWLAVYPREESESAPRIFGEASRLRKIAEGLRSKRTGKALKSVPQSIAGELPSAWSPLGKGWPAFEEALARATEVSESAKRESKLAAKRMPKPTISFRDPRELRY